VFLTLFYTLCGCITPVIEKYTVKQYFIFKRRGLVSSFYIHVSGSGLYIPRIGLIFGISIFLFCMRELSAQPRSGEKDRELAAAGSSSLPSPPLLRLSREYINDQHTNFQLEQLWIVNGIK
jgi:hypothetical protein